MDVRKVKKALIEQRKMNLSGNLYHKTQLDFAYNTNHIECQKCSMKVIDCAYNYFRNKKTSVAKLHSFI